MVILNNKTQCNTSSWLERFALIDSCRWFLTVWSMVQAPHGLDFKVYKNTWLVTVSGVGTLNGDLVSVGPILQGR